jgi:hypothetical protein
MIDKAIETNCEALRNMLILPQPANALRYALLSPGGPVTASAFRYELGSTCHRSRLANICGHHSRVRQGHLAQRILLQRDGYRLLKGKSRSFGHGLRLNCRQQPHDGQHAQTESVASFQPCTPTARAGFIHAVLSSTISCVVWKLALFCTIAPTEQYLSSERRFLDG